MTVIARRVSGLIIFLAVVLGMSPQSLAEPVPKPLPWMKIDELYFTPTQARMYGYNNTCNDPGQPWNAIFMETGFAGACGPNAQGVWHTVDLISLGVPADASVAFLSGAIVVSPYAAGTADIHISLRPFGSSEDPTCNKYLGQAVSGWPNVLDTQIRSNFSTWIGLLAGKFQYCYRIPNPLNASFGLNMSIQAWGRTAPQQLGLVTSTSPAPQARRKSKSVPAPPAAPQSACKAILGSLCPEGN